MRRSDGRYMSYEGVSGVMASAPASQSIAVGAYTCIISAGAEGGDVEIDAGHKIASDGFATESKSEVIYFACKH